MTTTLTPHAQGTFCWPELMTTDTDAAKKFYGALFGWTVNELPLGPNDPPYLMFQKDGKDVAAGYVLQPEQRAQGVPPYWGNYVAVTSVDEIAAKATQLGATVIMPPMDVMESGRMAIIQDPQGAIFGVWQAKNHIGAQTLDEPGALCWTECYTLDQDKAKDFYTRLIGWSAADMPMEKMVYTMFKRGDGASAAGLMKVPAEAQGMPPNWLSYFQTADLAKSTEKVKELGGNVVVGPMPIPNIGAFSIVTDPQGATFGLFQM